MKLKHAQNGASLYVIGFILLLLGFTVFVTLKLFPVYMEDFAVQSSIEGIEQDKAAEFNSAMSVRSSVARHFELNNIHQVANDDIIVEREGDRYLLDIDYEVRLPFIKNIDLVLSFKHHGEVRAR